METIDVPGVGPIRRKQHEYTSQGITKQWEGKWEHANGAPLTDLELRTVMQHLKD